MHAVMMHNEFGQPGMRRVLEAIKQIKHEAPPGLLGRVCPLGAEQSAARESAERRIVPSQKPFGARE